MSVETNWAGNHTYRARIEQVGSLEHLQEVVVVASRARALGSRHRFTDLTGITDTDEGVHFTWVRDPERVYALLPALEAALLPLGSRPHWGRCFAAGRDRLDPLYPRMGDSRALRDRVDPDRVFDHTFLRRVIG